MIAASPGARFVSGILSGNAYSRLVGRNWEKFINLVDAESSASRHNTLHATVDGE
jgi:hypothetical protein